ncbi:CotH kinase family protein [Psychroserpens sp.]|uniref:CotH kinase family protein n=1 Tax=Psychroserpens sp. TaxID=2020870 RepID=UPI00385C53C3
MLFRSRGNLSLSFPKKSYDIEFWKDDISRESKDLKFMSMRSDDDWILDGLYDEPLKLRSHVAAQLWTDINEPYYILKAPRAKSGFNSNFVELFRNNQYLGIYALTEQVDSKLLRLAKNETSVVHGELFKANSYKGGPAFEKAGKYNNLFPHYLGFRMEYPIIDYNSHWNNLSELLDLIVNQSDDLFIDKIAQEFLLSNAVDYFIFANLLHAGDNLGKNYYLGKYDSNEPYFIIPWDLDSTFGNSQDKIRQTNTDEILTNGLFKRLLSLNPNAYKAKLKSRWLFLREKKLTNSNVIEMFDDHYNKFINEKVYERNLSIWPKRRSNENDYGFLIQWVNSRLSFLDKYFESL